MRAVHSGTEIRQREASGRQIMSGANASPIGRSHLIPIGRSHLIMRRILLHIAVAGVLAAGSLPALQAQNPTSAKWTPARTADGHPDMQGMWARRGAAMGEANAPKTPLSEFGTTGQPYPKIGRAHV